MLDRLTRSDRPPAADSAGRAGGTDRRNCTDRRPDATPGDGGGGRSRAQSSLIGFLLLFGILVMLVALIQVAAVPDWNRGVEVQHNERVIGDMQGVSGDIQQVAASGQSRSTTVELGMRYPTRPFLINPTDPAGQLRTTDAEPFEVRNVEIRGVDNYWRDGEQEGVIDGTSRHLIYEPDYNEHEAAPRTVYENGILYNERDRRAVLDEESFVDGHRVSLTAVQGDVDRSRQGSARISTRAESAPAQAVPVSSADGDPVAISVPTRLPESEWEELLSDEFQRNAGHIVGDEAGVTVDDGTLTVELEAGIEYDLSLARVAVDDDPDRTDPHYITDIRGGETPIGPEQSERITFEVRDELNNPKSGVPVEFEADDGDLSRESATTGTDGQVVVRYTAPAETGEFSVTATADIEGETEPTVNEQSTVPISVVSAPGTAPGPAIAPDTFVRTNPGVNSDRVRLTRDHRQGTGVDLHFRNQADRALTLREIRVPFYHLDEIQAQPTSGTYNFGGTTREFNIPGEFVSVTGPTVQPGGTTSISLRNFRPDPRGDMLLMHTVWEDPDGNRHIQSYFVSISN